MDELVLGAVSSYENKISTIEDLLTNAYQTTIDWDENYDQLRNEREKLKAALSDLLAQNCSLRKKDFNLIVKKILSKHTQKKSDLEKRQVELISKINKYLTAQKELTKTLKDQVVQLESGKVKRESIELTLNDLKLLFQGEGSELTMDLRSFQLELDAFQREEEEINRKLARLIERGKSLRTEDLRELEAAEEREKRKIEKQLRHDEVENYILQCRQHRYEIGQSK